MSKDTPAPAAEPPVALALKEVKLTRIASGNIHHPAILGKGPKPAKGTLVTVKLENGVTYVGTVSDTITEDGQTLVEFKDGLTPVPNK